VKNISWHTCNNSLTRAFSYRLLHALPPTANTTASAALQEAELEKKRAKEAEKEVKALISKTKAKNADGTGHVWVRNENLTLRVGKLPPHWEKKIDQVCFSVIE